MEFLLPKGQLKGLSEEDQKIAKDEALNQFLLGSIFGGGGISTGYQAVQNIIPNIQKQNQQQGLLSELQGIQQDVFPTSMQAGQRAMGAEGKGPTLTAAQNQLNILNQPVDFNQAYSRLGRLATNPAATSMLPGLTGILKDIRPEYVDGMRVDKNTGKVLSGLPTQKDQIQTQYNNVTGQFESKPVVGGLEAKVATTLPEVPVGSKLSFGDAGILQANLIPGMSQVNQQLGFDKRFGEGQAALQTTPTSIPNLATGRPTYMTQAQALGQPSGLSPSETQAYEAYKPIRDDAFKKYQAATSSDTSLQNMQNILNRGAFKPGKFAEFKSEAAAIATGLGIGGQAAKNMAVDSPLFIQTLSDNVSTNIQDMSGAISNADVIFQKQRGPQIKDPEQAVQYYLDLKQSLNKRNKDYYNYVAKNPVPDVVEKWSQTPQGSASIFEDPKLRKYLPKFPVTQGPDRGKTAYQLPTGSIVLFD